MNVFLMVKYEGFLIFTTESLSAILFASLQLFNGLLTNANKRCRNYFVRDFKSLSTRLERSDSLFAVGIIPIP